MTTLEASACLPVDASPPVPSGLITYCLPLPKNPATRMVYRTERNTDTPLLTQFQVPQFQTGATFKTLRAGRSGNLNPVGVRFSAPVQTGPGAPTPQPRLHNGYWVSLPGIKRLGPGVDHPPHIAPRLKKE
jgi:hypothetical protein